MLLYACLALMLAYSPRGSLPAIEVAAYFFSPCFPTAVGTAWHYRLSNDTDSEFRIASARRVGDATAVDIELVIPIGDKFRPAGGRQASGRLEVSAAGVREAREFPGNSANDRPVPLLRLPFMHCDAWTADTDFPLLGGWVVPNRPPTSRYHFEFVATGWEWVTVPAGTFLALRVESVSSVADAPRYSQVRWFCPGVGIVRWERGRVQRRPSVWELIAFRLGK